jgi:hypothetical protein
LIVESAMALRLRWCQVALFMSSELLSMNSTPTPHGEGQTHERLTDEVTVVISSRTPEGTPGRCPVCHHEIKIDPSKPTLDGPCPHCGHLLWFVEGRLTSRRHKLIDNVLQIATARFGPPSCEMRAVIESVLEVERLEHMLKFVVECGNWNELVTNLSG